MSRDDTPRSGCAASRQGPAETVALRVQPRPVTVGTGVPWPCFAGGLSAAVLGLPSGPYRNHRSHGRQRSGRTGQRRPGFALRRARPTALGLLQAAAGARTGAAATGRPLAPPSCSRNDLRYPAADTWLRSLRAETVGAIEEAEEAAASSVFFRTGGQRPAMAAPAQPVADGTTLAGFDPLATVPPRRRLNPEPTAVQNRREQKEAFLQAGTTDTRNSGSLQLPVSPYQVMAGTVIAGALVTGIKSDLPGDVIGTVTEPVYDTATGSIC